MPNASRPAQVDNIIVLRPEPEAPRRPAQRAPLPSVIDPGAQAPEPAPPRLLERVGSAARVRHLSRRTEKAYVGWAKRFILFYHKRHPSEIGGAEVGAFLSSLATDRHVSASTQNQALAALLFLYQVVLQIRLPWIEGLVHAKRPVRLPVVLTRAEVQALLDRLEGDTGLVARLLYGSGLRL